MEQQEFVVRAIDVGRGNTKYVRSVKDGKIVCDMFPSIAIPTDMADDPARSSDRNTVCIPIKNLAYEVGPDIHLAADVFTSNVLQHDRYTETPEYLALTRAAMTYMNVPRIDLLIVGLPVASTKLAAIATEVEKRLTGNHEIGGDRRVLVKRVKALAQPAGALMYYGASHNKFDEIKDDRSLIIDPGQRTFDWLVTQGMRQIIKRSSSVDRGMFDVLKAVADRISIVTGSSYREYELIDRALRTGKKLTLFQKEHSLDKYLDLARTIPTQAVGEMRYFVGDGSDIRHIVLGGGGAHFFKPAIQQGFPKHVIHECKNPLFAIVHGFQIAGMELAKKLAPEQRHQCAQFPSEAQYG